VAVRFEADGLEPAGDNGTYFQFVPFRSFHPDEKHTSLTLLRDGKEDTLTFRQDFITYRQTTRTETSVEAPVVDVGYGITAPDQRYDDYQGVDAKGKIVAFVYGAPTKFESTVRAHYYFRTLKAANAVAHGAVGFLYLHTPEQEHIYSKAATVLGNRLAKALAPSPNKMPSLVDPDFARSMIERGFQDKNAPWIAPALDPDLITVVVGEHP